MKPVVNELFRCIIIKMIKVNGRNMEWHPGLHFREIYSFLGYNVASPLVVIRVNGRLVKKSDRKGFEVPDKAVITVINALRGG